MKKLPVLYGSKLFVGLPLVFKLRQYFKTRFSIVFLHNSWAPKRLRISDFSDPAFNSYVILILILIAAIFVLYMA
jgi:hypothetical protein